MEKKRTGKHVFCSIRVIPAKEKITISFHQEKLLNSSQREEMKSYWDNIIDAIKGKLT